MVTVDIVAVAQGTKVGEAVEGRLGIAVQRVALTVKGEAGSIKSPFGGIDQRLMMLYQLRKGIVLIALVAEFGVFDAGELLIGSVVVTAALLLLATLAVLLLQVAM
ncbi:hypothetical protein ACKC9G_15670 [Pokkaliibacter sp. CJK22405]|uniref:hypothetical protein n=1 Tax=Pokkaliibacter sp. CJK22405 TaxID=3384615 RepID=UPI003984EBCC